MQMLSLKVWKAGTENMNDAVVFGTGKVGKLALPFVEKEFRILFWTDNDKKKWGKSFGRYKIVHPDAVVDEPVEIIIASTKYGTEIADQLAHMGVSKDRIYLCRQYQTDSGDQIDIYPLLEEMLLCKNIPLIQYDLFQRKECESTRKKILVFCSFFTTFTKLIIENMAKRYPDIEFALITNTMEYRDTIDTEQLKHIYYFKTMADLKTILGELPVYHAAQMLWIEREWAYFYKRIREKAVRLNLHVGGSEFYRVGTAERNFKKDLIACADRVTVLAEATKEEFGTYYGECVKGKTLILPIGIEVLEWINRNADVPRNVIKEKFRIPQGRLVVTCGHNANSAHRHGEMIEELKKLPDDIKQQLVCVFPMTYPKVCDSYIHEIEEQLKDSELTYVILTKFMNFEEMALYAIISDIMIHVQTTDSLSSAMREEMYAGSVILAGRWLPYQSLHKEGIYFLDIGNMSNLSDLLSDVVKNIDKYKGRCTVNRAIMWKHSSWEAVAPKWYALWTQEK